MTERPKLNSNQFLLHFATENGVEAKALATFLQRAATVARGQNADLRVIGIQAGSLNVIIAAAKR